eukprot:scaffold36295_cov126-Isochrysis_galbana.AAC.5
MGEALKINTVLTTLKCALAFPPSQVKLCLLCCQQGLTILDSSLFGPRSLERNRAGDIGARSLARAFKDNKALTSLKCAPASPPPQVKMRSLCCQQGLTAVIAPCLALAVFEATKSVQKAPSTSVRLSRSTRH